MKKLIASFLIISSLAPTQAFAGDLSCSLSEINKALELLERKEVAAKKSLAVWQQEDKDAIDELAHAKKIKKTSEWAINPLTSIGFSGVGMVGAAAEGLELLASGGIVAFFASLTLHGSGHFWEKRMEARMLEFSNDLMNAMNLLKSEPEKEVNLKKIFTTYQTLHQKIHSLMTNASKESSLSQGINNSMSQGDYIKRIREYPIIEAKLHAALLENELQLIAGLKKTYKDAKASAVSGGCTQDKAFVFDRTLKQSVTNSLSSAAEHGKSRITRETAAAGAL